MGGDWLGGRQDTGSGQGTPEQSFLLATAAGPGISSYASNPAQAGESLRGCLEEALALIPEAQHRGTPMFLGATAGMRLLSQKNSSQAGDIFAAVTRVLGGSPVDFQGAKLLDGQDEGAFGWITINYVLGLLIKYSFSGKWTRPPEGTLVGALDLGGASTQIAFVPRGPVLDTSTQATFHLYGSSYSVYTRSYLCYGRDQMLSRLLAGLVQRQNHSAGPVGHPCYHSGYRTTLPLASLYESPCVHTAAPQNLTQNLTVEGTGNPGACVVAIRELFNCSSHQGLGDCAFDRVHQPPLWGQFYVRPPLPARERRDRRDGPSPGWLLGTLGHLWVGLPPTPGALGRGPRDTHVLPPQAFSNFYYTFHFLNLTSQQSLGAANDTVWEFCQESWEQVEASYPGQDRWLRDYCACGLYILTLLTEGYGFSEETWPSIQFRKQAGGMDIGWTLGYMLNLTGMIPAEAPAQWRAESYGIWAAGVAFVVLTLLAVLGAAAVQFIWPRD
nr:ectonucleoside triphosphate diphosphohydrolase 8 isoform X2 [Microcebus murinus]